MLHIVHTWVMKMIMFTNGTNYVYRYLLALSTNLKCIYNLY